ncbi:hypothetical protein AB4090_05145 [Acidithiobacillus sp. IBUN Pt1247-S3]|uniref:hypothetical protein n=1 Tax=Acidithiobacillus sp. IBUN Pt1247-S3 TaxID=3166642 RepID=UPI0034E42687
MLLGVKHGLFRIHDPQVEEADQEYQTIRYSVFRRDRYTCRFCGMRTVPASPSSFSGFFEIHHADDDHRNNDADNLLTVCPFCHSVFHCGNAGHRESGSIIWLPVVRQEDLNLAVHVLFILLSYGEEGNSLLENARKANNQNFVDQALNMASRAAELYETLRQLMDDADREIGMGMSNAAVLGESLTMLYRDDPKLYDQRAAFLHGARFLPDYDYYRQASAYWAAANTHKNGGGEVISPQMLVSHFQQLQRVIGKTS